MNKWLKRGLTALLCSLFCLTGVLGFAACNKGKDSSDSSSESVSESTEDSSVNSSEEHEHNYTETIIVEASCKAEGQKKLTCACGDEKTESIPMSAHVEVVLDEVPATCTSTGLTEGKKCFTCGDILVKQEVIDKKAHDFTAQSTLDKYCASEATCTSVATYYYSCKVCGEADTKTFESGSVKAHAWIEKVDDKYLVSEATCTAYAVYNKSCEHCGVKGTETFESGVKADHVFDKKDTGEKYVATKAACEQNATYYYSCNACGEKGTETFEDVGSALKHEYTGELVEPTCLEEGYYVYTCGKCNHKYSDMENMVPANGHTYEEVVTPASCTAQGYTTYKCSCGDSYEGNYTEIAQHDYQKVETIAPTCQAKGYDLFECADCGDTKKDNYSQDLAEHQYTEEITKAATCEEAGEKTIVYTCACNKTLTEKINPTNHNYVAGTPVAPTCTEGGYTVYTCSNDGCGHSYKGNEIDATGHKPYTGVVTQAPTCTEKGIMTYTCDACDDSYTEELDEKGHDYEATNTVAPTCTKEGYTTYTCKNDSNHTYNDDFTDATGHDHQEVETKQPTCTEKGYIKYECACGDEYSTELEENGHTIDENAWVLVTDGEGNEILTQIEGCTYEKKYTQTCGACGDVVEKTAEVIKHNYAVAITETATCLSDGVKTFTCTVEGCGHSYDEGYSAPEGEGHIWSAPSTTGGVEIVVCTVEGCGAEKTTIKAEEGATNARVDKGALSQTGEIQMDAATIKMDENVKNQLTDGEGALDIHASTLGEDDKNAAINNVTDPALRDKLQTQPIFNFTVEDENGTTISQFNGKMTVTVPYDLNGQDAEGIAVYFLNDNGEIEEIEAIYTEINGQGYATFETDHFSKYTVVRLTPSERCALYGHDWKNRTVPASCTTDGYYLEYCIRCGTNETIEVYTATGHSYTEYVTAVTCTTQGYTTYICERENCGSRYNADFVAALGHSYTESVTDPTCTKRGYTTYTCQNDNCGNSYNSNFVAALGHSYTTEVTDPTCEDKGYTTYTCDCGYQYVSDYKAALGHNYQEEGVEEPTCTAPGHTKFKCQCGKGYNGKYTPAKGHKYGKGNKHDATCQKGGYTEYKCEYCDDQYEADFTPTTKHDYDANGVKHDATCYDKGYTRHNCKHCDAYYDDKFEDKKKHEYEATVIAPTCVAKGYTLYTCKHHGNCKDSYKSDYVPALGHVWGSDYICTREDCGAEHPALSHGNQNFYITLRDSVMNAASYYVTLENFKYDETYTENDVVTETHIGSMTILKFTFAFDDNGYLVGHGEFEMPFIHSDYKDGEVSYEESETTAAKVIFADGYFYVFASNAEDEYISENYIMLPQDMLTTAMNFPILQLKTMYMQFYGENARKLLTAALGTTDADVNAALGSIMEFLFVKTETGEGYTFTIDADQIYNVIEKFATQSVKEIFDTFFGAGALDRLFDWAVETLDKTVGELEADIEENLIAAGYTLDDLYGFINDTAKTIVGEDADEFDFSEMLEEIRGEVIGELLVNGMFEGDMTVEDIKDMLSQIRDLCADNNIISLILQMSGEAEDKEEADEYVDELLEEAKDISKYIGKTEITISTNKQGLASAIEFNLDIKIESKMSSSLGFTRLNTIRVTGNGKITLNGSYEMDFADLKDKVENLFDKIDLKDGNQIGEYIVYRNGNDMLIARDVTVLMNSQPDYMENLGAEEIDGVVYEKYTAMWSYLHMVSPDGMGMYITSNYGYYFKDGYGIVTDDVCGDWKSYVMLGNECYVYYTLWINMESGSFRSEIDWDKTANYYMGSGSFDFWYNEVTGEYSDHSMHNYCEVERHDPETCGEMGWQVFECATCGDSYRTTWMKDHNIEWKSELLEGATSCYDGIAEIRYCTECDYEEREIYGNAYHDSRWQEITIQTECGEVRIGYEVCACGYSYYEWLEVKGDCQFEEFSGDKIEKYGFVMEENVKDEVSSVYPDHYESWYEDSSYEEKPEDYPEEDSFWRHSITYVCQHCGKTIVLTMTNGEEGCYRIGSFTITVDEEVVVEKEYSSARHLDISTTNETVDGITTETRTCECGVVVSVQQYDEWGRELYNVNEKGFGYAYEYVGCEYEYYKVTPNERIHLHGGKSHASSKYPVYVLMEGATSCLDGVYAEHYCACCGELTGRGNVYSEEHSFNRMEKVIETPCGSFTIIYGTCACGEEKIMDDFYGDGCEFIAIGTTAYRCEKCGLTLVLSYETAQEGCTEITTFACNVYMDGDVNGVAAWTFEGHFSEIYHTMNKWIETDENGNKVVVYGCEVCSYFEEKTTYDQYNRELRYERGNGNGYYYVYNDDCTYTRYEFDRFGNEYASGGGQQHIMNQRRVFIGEANCEAGVKVEYYCVVCGRSDKSYEYYHHEWFDQIVYEGVTACGRVEFINYGCLCGMHGKGDIRHNANCNFSDSEDWLEDTDTEFDRWMRTCTCYECGWTYTEYTYQTQEACTTRYYTVYNFGVNGDVCEGTYTMSREEVNHANFREEEGANDQGVYVYARYCAECGKCMEHWERDYDDRGRQIYYMDRLNGYGWERVYSDTDCTYVQYQLDQLGDRVDSYEGFEHASIYSRCELMEGATTCDEGIYIIEYCIACNMITSQYESFGHCWYEHIEKFDTYCDGGVTVRYEGCACGLKGYTWLEVSGGCNIEHVETTWPDFDETNPKHNHYIEEFKCAITACGFSYTSEYYYIVEEDTCMATYVCVYTLYNNAEVIYAKTFTREEHHAQIESYTERDANGYIIHVNDCKYCDWVEKYDRYGRTIYYWNPYDNYGYSVDYYDGCNYYREEFNSEGVYWTSDGTNHQMYWREVYPACTQYGTAFEYCRVCGLQDTYDYVEPGHDYIWDDAQGLYVCDRCGLKNEKNADGDFLVEDLTHQYGNYTAGFFNRLGKQWQMDEGYNFYIMLNYTVDENGNVTDGVNVTDMVEFDFFTYGYETEPAGSGIITLDNESLWNAIYEVYGENAEGYQHVSIVFQVFDKYEEVDGDRYYSYVDHVLTFGV